MLDFGQHFDYYTNYYYIIDYYTKSIIIQLLFQIFQIIVSTKEGPRPKIYFGFYLIFSLLWASGYFHHLNNQHNAQFDVTTCKATGLWLDDSLWLLLHVSGERLE